jgi:hypothetical protein
MLQSRKISNFKRRNMDPLSTQGHFTHLMPLLETVNNKDLEIIENTHTETIKRLRLKFPRCLIEDHEVQFLKIKYKDFSDVPIEPQKANRLATADIFIGYIVSFRYKNNKYDLMTKTGEFFQSDQLNFDDFPLEILDSALKKLSSTLNATIGAENIELLSVEENEGTTLTYSECNKDLDLYMSQREVVYLINLTHEGTEYEFCLNEQGESRHVLM